MKKFAVLNKSLNDNCCKNNSTQNKGMGRKKVEKEDLKGFNKFEQPTSNFQLIFNFS